MYPRKRVKRTAIGRYTSFRARLARLWYLFRIAVFAFVTMAIIAVGAYLYGMSSVYAYSTTNIITTAQSYPILHKIARAESGDSQVGRDGQVVVHVNTDGTYDIGRYQINSRWNAEATKLGYNLYVEKDNEAFARYLFTNYGSEPWHSSIARWNRS